MLLGGTPLYLKGRLARATKFLKPLFGANARFGVIFLMSYYV
jgi:hypothetical protein